MTRGGEEGTGTVFLVGAGPGDPGLITVKGAQCLRSADVVLYDRLVDRRLLAMAPPHAELIDVGKVRGDRPDRQDGINALLIEKARAGGRVVRLKGGDPFVFGRGGEEAAALSEAGVPYQVVPGVTSAVAAPAYAGIPLTHRGYASSFTVLTGSEAPGKDERRHRLGQARGPWRDHRRAHGLGAPGRDRRHTRPGGPPGGHAGGANTVGLRDLPADGRRHARRHRRKGTESRESPRRSSSSSATWSASATG